MPGLIRGVARTAAIAGTATAVSNRSLPRTSTSAAKITASAESMMDWSSGSEPAEPWVSTCISSPASAAACSSASAAM